MAPSSRNRDPEIRRRAAWLLGMLGLVAALLVLIMVVFFNGGGGSDDIAGPGPTSTPTPTPTTPSPRSPARTSDSPSSASSGSASDSSSTTASSGASGGKVECPSDELCGLDSDVGDAVAAVNAYRVDQGKDPVPGTVSSAATKCALSNGSDCSGGWSQTTIPLTDGKADGVAAVDKVKTRGKLLSDMSSFSVGWAFDPDSKTLYFAVIRKGD